MSIILCNIFKGCKFISYVKENFIFYESQENNFYKINSKNEKLQTAKVAWMFFLKLSFIKSLNIKKIIFNKMFTNLNP